MVKKILIGIGVLVVVVLLIGFLMPGKMEVSKSISINAPAEYAFEEVNNLENNPKWSYWNSIYEEMTVSYGDVKAGVGAVSEWDGPESGKGKMTIVESVPNQSIKMDLDFMEQGTAQAWYTFEPEGEGTKLTTGFTTDFGMNPIGRLMGALMVKGEMEKSFDYNLNKIKEIAEAKPKFVTAISEAESAAISYVGISSTMSIEDMNAISMQMMKSYGELMTMLGKSKVEVAGQPFCLYPMYDEAAKKMEMVCALPVAADAKVPSKYKVMQTPGGKVVKGVHLGSYDKLEVAHQEISQYIEYKKLQINGVPYEVYVTDPEVEKDTTKWVTEVYYPIGN
jgi:effector-binding domain-containing protein/carbon monoxide dehydrogenase subunit G